MKTPKFWLLAFFWGNIVIIVGIFWVHSAYYIHHPEDGNRYIAIGRITGLLAEFLMLNQLALIGRIKFIESVFGFDVLNKFHRFLGYTIMAGILIHPIALIYGNALANGVSFVYQFSDFLANKNGVYLSFISILLLIFIVVITLERKKFKYETWYFAHLLTYAVIGLAFTHQLNTGDLRTNAPLYYWLTLHAAVLFFVLCYRLVRPLLLSLWHGFYIDKVEMETHDTCSLYIKARNMKGFHFEAGQYANITILARGRWFTHPFSFSSDYNGEYIRFTIKQLGDYTNALMTVTPGTYVIIDGPLGRFVRRTAIRDKLFFIAGGIGITPIRAMMEGASKEGKDMVLMYANKTIEDVAFTKELEVIQATSPEHTKIHHVFATPTAGFESGFIDKEKIVRLVPDFYDREVFLCGPPPMMTAMVTQLKELGFSLDHVHFEKFSF